MCVKVFLADDAEIMRRAIRSLLSNREDIAVVGEASNFHEMVRKSSELHPDLIILDVGMSDRGGASAAEVKGLLNNANILAITLGGDDVSHDLINGIGAAKLLDKMDLATQLIPTILEMGLDGHGSR
jgi:DNA-binding NarL/FixJ family response regulator